MTHKIQDDSPQRKPDEENPKETAIIKDASASRRPPASVPMDEEPPESSRRKKRTDEPPPPLSRFAVRDDGALLLSTEDAADRDLTGRELQTFLVLTEEERARARETADDGLYAAAAVTIGSLPKRSA